MEAYCTVKTCNTVECENRDRLCSFDVTIPVKNGLFLEESTNDTGTFESRSIIWSQQGIRRGILSVQLQNSKQV